MTGNSNRNPRAEGPVSSEWSMSEAKGTKVMMIPTEPIGSIPRPLALIEAIRNRGGGDAALEPLYENAVRDTIERFNQDASEHAVYLAIRAVSATRSGNNLYRNASVRRF